MFIAVFRIRRNNAGFLRRPASADAGQGGYTATLSQAKHMQESS